MRRPLPPSICEERREGSEADSYPWNDLAEEGLRRANATYFDSHTTDDTSLLTFAMDLTPLIRDDKLSAEEFTLGFIDRLKDDVRDRMRKFR